MDNSNNRIAYLESKLDDLLRRHKHFSDEILALRTEIQQLRQEHRPSISISKEKEPDTYTAKAKQEVDSTQYQSVTNERANKVEEEPAFAFTKPPKQSWNLEKFIGENLINKIGIAITIIGVAIGAKYSIEHDLISPVLRIIMGYLAGLVMLGIGIKLKQKYENYSAVLVSGAMAILYFITFTAYSFYALMPQSIAFGLMVLFTIFTVGAALTYNKQVIAHIGLVGAYAVPFLLSDGSGKVLILFSYIAIINFGILIITFKRYWKELFYSSFGLTWLIYASWFTAKYNGDNNFALALTFLSIFFITFYLIFITYKIKNSEKVLIHDVGLILANSFLFYGFGYAILNNHETGKHLLGLFTLISAIIHFAVSLTIYRQKLADRNLFYLVSGLVLVFITIAIPVQLSGNWVTLLWAGEAALLFWIGKTRSIDIYEKLSYPLMILAFGSIAHDWLNTSSVVFTEAGEHAITPFANINYLSALLFAGAFGFITYLSRTKAAATSNSKGVERLSLILAPAIMLMALYISTRIEISTYWNNLYSNSALVITPSGEEYPNYYWNEDYSNLKWVWLANFTLLFAALLTLANQVKIKSPEFGKICTAISLIAIVLFLTQGLFALSELRESYIEQTLSEYYSHSVFNIWIRYISLAFAGVTLWLAQVNLLKGDLGLKARVAAELFILTALVWIASSELLNWLDIAKSNQSYKLGLSILWGICALAIVVLGIWKKRKHLRIGAIVLFAITLVKLFVYDISHLDTIAKTIVFVSLGVLLLVISFLYNKYKNIIADDSEN